MSKLKTVANLNLQNISLDDFTQTVRSLGSMPALRSLYVNLAEEDQVDLIMRLLPDLEFLNGLPVDRDAIDEENQNQSIDPNVQNDSAMAV